VTEAAGSTSVVFDDDLESFLHSLDELGLGPNVPRAAEREGSGGGGWNLDKKTLPELKALLKSRGLPVSGKKADLISRLEN
jgi:hypothetical protein